MVSDKACKSHLQDHWWPLYAKIVHVHSELGITAVQHSSEEPRRIRAHAAEAALNTAEERIQQHECIGLSLGLFQQLTECGSREGSRMSRSSGSCVLFVGFQGISNTYPPQMRSELVHPLAVSRAVQVRPHAQSAQQCLSCLFTYLGRTGLLIT